MTHDGIPHDTAKSHMTRCRWYRPPTENDKNEGIDRPFKFIIMRCSDKTKINVLVVVYLIVRNGRDARFVAFSSFRRPSHALLVTRPPFPLFPPSKQSFKMQSRLSPKLRHLKICTLEGRVVWLQFCNTRSRSNMTDLMAHRHCRYNILKDTPIE
jgi:hypothetical protein